MIDSLRIQRHDELLHRLRREQEREGEEEERKMAVAATAATAATAAIAATAATASHVTFSDPDEQQLTLEMEHEHEREKLLDTEGKGAKHGNILQPTTITIISRTDSDRAHAHVSHEDETRSARQSSLADVIQPRSANSDTKRQLFPDPENNDPPAGNDDVLAIEEAEVHAIEDNVSTGELTTRTEDTTSTSGTLTNMEATSTSGTLTNMEATSTSSTLTNMETDTPPNALDAVVGDDANLTARQAKLKELERIRAEIMSRAMQRRPPTSN
jgi:hypothetical protein